MLSEKEKHFTIGKLDSNFANSYIDIPYQSGLLNAISKVNPDIIISDGFFQWTFAAVLKSYRRKVCVFYERTEFVERNAPKWRILYRKSIGKFIDGFLINGSLTRKYLDSMGFSQKPKVEGCMVADCEGLSKAVESCPESVKSNLKKSLDIQDEGLFSFLLDNWLNAKGSRNFYPVGVNISIISRMTQLSWWDKECWVRNFRIYTRTKNPLNS